MPKKSKKSTPTKHLLKPDFFKLILIAISIGVFLSVVRYCLRTNQIPEWDEELYMHMASGFYRILQTPSLSSLNEMLQILPTRQPGYSLFILPFLLIFGPSHTYLWGIITNGIFFIATVWGVYFLGKEYLSRQSSLLGAIIFTSFGWPLFYLHQTYSETATSALCLWAIYFLVKSKLFSQKLYSILFGIFVGLAILTRWVSFVFLFGPMILTLYQFIKRNRSVNKRSLSNIGLAGFLALLIPIYPYVMNFHWVYEGYIRVHRVGGPMWATLPENERAFLSLYSLTFYFQSFEQLGIFFFILIAVGGVLALRKKSALHLPLLVVAVAWIFFSMFSIIKADRFILPIYPFLAILAASIFDEIRNYRFKFFLSLITIIICILSFLGTVWGKGPMQQSRQTITIIGTPIHLTAISRPPNVYRLSGKEIIQYIAGDSNNDTKKSKTIALFSFRPLDTPMASYNQYHTLEPISITNFVGTVISIPEKEIPYLVNEELGRSTYLLIKTGKITDSYFPKENYTTLKLLQNAITPELITKYFEKKKDFWIYQDSSTVTLYKKKKELSKDDREILINKLQIAQRELGSIN